MKRSALSGLGVLLLLLARDARSDDWARQLVGRWTRGDRVLDFLGGGVGRDSDGGGRFFCYIAADPAQLQIAWGGGAGDTRTGYVAGDELRLVEAGVTNAWARAPGTLSACQTNLLSLEAAKAVFRQDHPGAMRVSLAELVPTYLAAVPACESNAVYTLGPIHQRPSCSSHGALAD